MTDYTVEIQPDLIKRLAKTDPIKAVSELIWNGLDADAAEVRVDWEYNDLGKMSKIIVKDDGDGIHYKDAHRLFKRLGGSWKGRGARTGKGRQLHGHEGRGRYKAFSLGRVVDWHVTYENEDGKNYCYQITILEANTKKFTVSNEKETSQATGVRVEATELDRDFRVFEDDLAEQHFAEIFARYLKDYRDVSIYLQNEKIDVSSVISDTASYELDHIVDEEGTEHSLSLEVIEWNRPTEKVLYLCNEMTFPLLRVTEKRFHTGDFRFSAYLQSSYFEDLDEADQLNLAEMDRLASQAIDAAQDRIRTHFLQKTIDVSKSVVQKWKEEKVYPFEGEASSPIEQVEREVFDIVATTANDFMPDFEGSTSKQKAMHLHMLRSALERSPEDLQVIFQEVLDLPARKRKELSDLLADVSLTGIINAAKTVSDRLKFLDGLEAILYDEEKKAVLKERSQLHRILAEETWLFGEEFHLTADDEGLTKVLRKYARKMKIDVAIDKPVTRIDGSTGIIDLMFSKTLPSHKPEDSDHLVVELKAPKVTIGSKEITQIESYAYAIADDERFHGVRTRWNFWIISNTLDRFAEIKAKQDNLPQGAISRNTDDLDITIWAKTWSQVLDENRSRLRFFQQSLEQKISHEKGLKYLSKKYGSILVDVLEVSTEKEDEQLEFSDDMVAEQ